MSVSTTHRRPRQDSSTRTCRASCAARFGRNPNEHGNMSVSKIARARSSPRPARSAHEQRESRAGAARSCRASGSAPDASAATDTGPVHAIAVHRDPRTPQNVPAVDLVPQRVERLARDRPWPPGKAHAARHEPDPPGHFPDRPDPEAAGLADTALTGHLHHRHAHRRSSGPSLTGGCVVRSAQSVSGRGRRRTAARYLRPPYRTARAVFPQAALNGSSPSGDSSDAC
jgi:hypothetical protein